MRLYFFIFISITAFYSNSQTILFDSDQTVNTCSGFIIDSGNVGATGYSNNENTVVTICSNSPTDILSISFSIFNLSLQDDDPSPGVTNVDYMTIYDGPNTSSPVIGVYTGTDLSGQMILPTLANVSGCLTLQFTSNTIGTGNFAASASCDVPCSNPVAAGIIVGGITSDSIRVCIGEPVSFQNQGSFAQTGFNIVSYKWDFMDNTTATTQNTTHTFTTAGLYNVQLYVTDDNPDNVCNNNNLLDLQVLVAPKPNFTGFSRDTTLCIGESIVFNTVPENYEVTWTGFPNAVSILDGCITDDQTGVAQNVDLQQTGFIPGSTITNVNQIVDICLDMEHTFVGDIVVTVNCPNGQSVILHQQGGGGTDLGVPVVSGSIDCNDPSTIGVPSTYCFTPTASDTWVDWCNANSGATTLPAGNYASIDPMSNLIGCPTNGVWTISIVDNWGGDDGAVFSFGLNLDPSLYPTITTFEPQIGWGVDSSYWEPSGSFISNISTNGDDISITPTVAGTYNYIYSVIDDFGCVNDTSVNLIVNSNPTVFAGNDTTLCDGGNLQLDGQVSGVTDSCDFTLFLEDTFGDGWNGNTITIDNNGVLTDYTLASLTAFDTIIIIRMVNGANVTATFNAIGSFISECSFTISDPNSTVIVTQGPGLSAGTVDAFVAMCSPGYVYNWSSTAPVSDPTILNPQLLSTTTQTQVLSVFPIGHPACVVTDDVLINFSVTPSAGNDSTLTICSDGTPVDLFPLLGAGAVINGQWLNSNNQITTMPYNPQTMNPGNFVYIANNNGCTDQSTVVVTEVSTQITNTQVTNVDCNNANNGIITITGTNITSYSINNGSIINATSPFTINSLSPGTYTIEVTGAFGCTDDTTVTITEPLPLQIIALTGDMTICSNIPVPLAVQATGGNGLYIYNWLENGVPIGQGATINVNPIIYPSQYCVVLSEACGSTPATQCMNIELAVPILPSIVPDTTNGCYPVTVNFTNTTVSQDIQTITVDFGDGTSSTYINTNPFTHKYLKKGLYTVTVTVKSVFDCEYTTVYSDLIEGFDYPIAKFSINPESVSMLDPKVTLTNQSTSDVVSYYWDIPNGNPSFSILNALEVEYPMDSVKNYPVKLIVTNDHECKDSITHNVIVNEEIILYAPNSFTPDGDSFNQTWEVFAVGINPYMFNLKIFNRWGQVVWESNNIEVGWDATYGGNDVQEGTYNWIVTTGNTHDDKKYTFKGAVNVLK